MPSLFILASSGQKLIRLNVLNWDSDTGQASGFISPFCCELSEHGSDGQSQEFPSGDIAGVK